MIDPTTTDPTAEEIAAANALIQRVNAAAKAKIDAVMPDMKAMVADAGFATLLANATAARDQLPQGTAFYSHLNGIVVCMTNLQNDVAA